MRSPASWLSRRQSPAAEKPLRDKLLSIDRLEERALALAASLTIDPNRRHRPRDTFPRFENSLYLRGHPKRAVYGHMKTGHRT